METLAVTSVEKRQGEEINGEEEGEESSSMISVNRESEIDIDVNLSSWQAIRMETSSASPSSLSAGGATTSNEDPMLNVISWVTQLDTKNKQLEGRLVLAQQMIAERDAKINEQNIKLMEAEKLIADQKRQLEIAVEKEVEADDKFAKLKNSMEIFKENYLHMFENVKEHLFNEGQQSISGQGLTAKKTLEENVTPEKDNLQMRFQSTHSSASVGDQSSPPTKGLALPPLSDESNEILDEGSENSADLLKLPNPRPTESNIIITKTSEEGCAAENHAEDIFFGRKQFTKEECEPSLVNTSSPSSRSFQTEFVAIGLPIAGGLQSKDVLESLNEPDDNETSIAQAPISNRPSINGDDDHEDSLDPAQPRNQRPPVTLPNKVLTSMSAEPVFVSPVIMPPNETQGITKVPLEPVFISGNKHSMDIAKRDQGIFCICGKGFSNRPNLDAHIQFPSIRPIEPSSTEEEDAPPNTKGQKIHGFDTKMLQLGLFYCICGKNCINEEKLQAHINYAKLELKFICEMCRNSFRYNSHLLMHLQRCHKIVAGNDAVGKQTQVHSTHRAKRQKSQCPKCEASFQTQSELLRHNKSVHKLTNFGQAAKSGVRKRKIRRNFTHHKVSSSSPNSRARSGI